VDVEGGQGWAGFVLATSSLVKGGGLEQNLDFCLLRVDLHTMSNTAFLANM